MESKVQRFDFQEFIDIVPSVKGPKVFHASKRQKEELPPPPPPPPTFSEEELKAAERDGYKKGFLEGTQEGRTQAENEQAAVERALAQTVEKFVQSIAPLFTDYRQMVMNLREQAPQVALAIARKVASGALEQNAAAVVQEVTLQCLDAMANEPKITITVHESLGDTLERKLQEIAARLPAATEIVIQRDPAMAQPDCRIEWGRGALARDTAQLWQQVEKAIGNMSAIATRDGTKQLEQLQAQVPGAQEIKDVNKE